jgi:transcription elongation GreA/GreB family factor
MSKLYTQKGLYLKQRQIATQEAKVRAVGREAGEEAGISCDWHDNFGYEDAKRRLEMESSLLSRLKEEITGIQLITIQEQDETVRVGVTVRAQVGGEEKEFTIGGYGESDPQNMLIAYTSPLAHAVIGMRKGESRSAYIGNRKIDVEIEAISPPSYKYHQLIQNLVAASENLGNAPDAATRHSIHR